jgi:O-antigen/teichoic acid export membrane protein
MTIMARVSREYLLQIVSFAVAILDRLLVPAILLRTIGVSGFSGWTVALAMAAFVPVLDFGLVRHFSIRLLSLRAQGREADAINEYRQGSLLLFCVSVIATAVLIIWLLVEPPRSGDPAVDEIMPNLLMPLIAAMLLNQAVSLRQALFRAHQQFGRETILRSAGDLLRVAVICGAALAGVPLVTLGWLWLASVVAGLVVPSIIDTRRRFPQFSWRWPVFRPGEMGKAVRASPGYWLAAMSTTIFASVPLLALGYWAAGALAVAQFGLMRTIANLVRQVLQIFANVFGLELGRRYALHDEAGFAKVFGEANRFLGTQAAVATVLLLVIGREFFSLWTGRDGLFDPIMLALAIIPPIILPGMILSMEALGYAGRQWAVVRLRLVQAMVTAISILFLPIEDLGLRMMAALALGEIVGLGVPLLWAMRGVNGRLTVMAQLSSAVWVVGALICTALFLWPVEMIPHDQPFSRIAAALVLSAVAFLVVTLLFGLSRDRRSMVLAQVQRRFSRSGLTRQG